MIPQNVEHIKNPHSAKIGKKNVTFKITAVAVLRSQMLRVLSKEELMQQSSKCNPAVTLFKHVAGVKF